MIRRTDQRRAVTAGGGFEIAQIMSGIAHHLQAVRIARAQRQRLFRHRHRIRDVAKATQGLRQVQPGGGKLRRQLGSGQEGLGRGHRVAAS